MKTVTLPLRPQRHRAPDDMPVGGLGRPGGSGHPKDRVDFSQGDWGNRNGSKSFECQITLCQPTFFGAVYEWYPGFGSARPFYGRACEMYAFALATKPQVLALRCDKSN